MRSWEALEQLDRFHFVGGDQEPQRVALFVSDAGGVSVEDAHTRIDEITEAFQLVMVGDDRVSKARPVAAVAVIAALCRMLRIADMVVHLDLQPGLEDLLGQIREQASRPDEAAPVGLGLLDELLPWPRMALSR